MWEGKQQASIRSHSIIVNKKRRNVGIYRRHKRGRTVEYYLGILVFQSESIEEGERQLRGLGIESHSVTMLPQ